MNDKIRVIEPRGKTLSDARAHVRSQMPEIIESFAITAEIRKASYDAHIKAGFTPDQALELCWRV